MSDEIPTVLGHYNIVSLIGAGGMGEVYLADDSKLGRRVAIKVLAEHVSGDIEAKRRLLREARAVAALDHPNVCTIYEVGEHEGRPYIVMQFIEGETLFDRLQQARFTLMECIDIGMQVAAALEEAHKHGVVHRDIKPLNIILTPRGQVKVLDFGLARFAEVMDRPSGQSETVRRSQTGVVSGTVPYMSPEQLRAVPVDARTDIFSLGIVLYEIATGRRPFDHDSAASTITAILFQEPAPIDDQDFAPLAPIIRRALAKEPAKRFSTAAMMLEALGQVKDRPRSRVRHLRTAELGATQVKAPATPQQRRIDSLAVVPFVSGKLDAELEYLVYGLSEGIVNALSRLRKLRVIAAPSTVDRYVGMEADPQEVGRALNVAAIVGVRARIDDDQLHADVSLTAAVDGSILWSSQYTRPIREVGALAEAIAGDVGDRVRARSSSTPRRTLKKKRAIDPEAQHLYLKGRFQWIKRHPVALKEALSLFQQAVEHDPFFALPYAGLADSFVMLGFMQALPPREILPKAKAAARRAIELDPTLADPHATIGYAAGLFEWDWDSAKRELAEAMRLNPSYPWAPHWLGLLMSGRGETRRALELIELAQTLDPLSPIINIAAGIPLHIARRYDDAVARYRSVLETETAFAPGHYYLGLSLEQRGDLDEAIKHFQRVIEIAGPASIYLGALAYSYGRAGRLPEAEAVVDQLRTLAKQRYVSSYNFAIAYSGMGRIDEALFSLEEALEEHNGWLWFLPVEPRFDPLRSDKRFAPLTERYGLKPAIAADE